MLVLHVRPCACAERSCPGAAQIKCAPHEYDKSSPICSNLKEDCERQVAQAKASFGWRGQCSEQLLTDCQQACTGCCGDTDPRCLGWGLGGECARNPGFMQSACKLSCHQCGGAPQRDGVAQEQALRPPAARRTGSDADVGHDVSGRESTQAGAHRGAQRWTSARAAATSARALTGNASRKALPAERHRLSVKDAPTQGGGEHLEQRSPVRAAAQDSPVLKETPLSRWEKAHPSELQLGAELGCVLLIGLAALLGIQMTRRRDFLASQRGSKRHGSKAAHQAQAQSWPPPKRADLADGP